MRPRRRLSHARLPFHVAPKGPYLFLILLSIAASVPTAKLSGGAYSDRTLHTSSFVVSSNAPVRRESRDSCDRPQILISGAYPKHSADVISVAAAATSSSTATSVSGKMESGTLVAAGPGRNCPSSNVCIGKREC